MRFLLYNFSLFAPPAFTVFEGGTFMMQTSPEFLRLGHPLFEIKYKRKTINGIIVGNITYYAPQFLVAIEFRRTADARA